jgi:hypothetical protein
VYCATFAQRLGPLAKIRESAHQNARRALVGGIEHDQPARDLSALVGIAIGSTRVGELGFEQCAPTFHESRALAEEPVVEGDADPVELFEQLARTIGGQFAAVGIL